MVFGIYFGGRHLDNYSRILDDTNWFYNPMSHTLPIFFSAAFRVATDSTKDWAVVHIGF